MYGGLYRAADMPMHASRSMPQDQPRGEPDAETAQVRPLHAKECPARLAMPIWTRTPLHGRLVEPRLAGRAIDVLHSDGHVAHEFAQLCGYTVEPLAHHDLESLGINVDHAASVQPDAIRAALRHPLNRI